MADTQNKAPETPFGLDFNQLLAQVTGGSAATQQATPQQLQAGAQQAQSAPILSFADLEKQIGGNNPTAGSGTAQAAPQQPQANAQQAQPQANAQSGAAKFNELVEKAQAEAAIGTPAKPESAPGTEMSIDEITKQALENTAQAAVPENPAQAMNAAVPENPAQAMNAPVAEEPAKAAAPENPAQAMNAPVTEEPAKAAAPENPAQAMNAPVAEEPAKAAAPEEKPAEKEKPKKTRSSSKTSKKQEEKKEPPKDITEDFRVDLGLVGAPSDDAPLSSLFTPEEVDALRANIRTFVRKELKLAVVGAVKELLHDFSK